MTTPIGSSSGSAPSASSSSNSSSSTISFFGNTPLSISRSLAASTFLAGDETITIIPSFHLPQPLELLSGTIGPFRAGMDAIVPLWLGTMLRRRKLAKLVPPTWMDMDILKEVLRFERDINEASFSPQLPFRHAEIARAILSACRAGSGTGSSGAGDAGSESEIRNADQIKLLLEDIAAVRMDKIRRNIHQLSSSTLRNRTTMNESIIDVTNIGSLEMHSIKAFVLESFRLQRELSGRGSSYSQDVEMDTSSNPSSGGGGGGGSGRRRSSGGGGGGMATNVSRSRLQEQSRLVRDSVNAVPREENEEELLEPRPLEEELLEPRPLEEDMEGGDESEGRSRLRRHR
ncbi:hypothetical protein ACHAXH_008402 [Discostella pseudostelligera]